MQPVEGVTGPYIPTDDFTVASYAGMDGPIDVDLSTGEAHGGAAEGDELTGITAIEGTEFDDRLFGGQNADTYLGSLLLGEGGDDVLTGSDGNDLLFGGEGDDLLYGADGMDMLSGGAGADEIDGAAGMDTVIYRGSEAGVSVDLSTGFAAGGDAEGDTLVSIEAIWRSSHNDTLRVGDDGGLVFAGFGDDLVIGGASADELDGEYGDDTIHGGGGDDGLFAGDGDDIVLGEGGNDQIHGGRGFDRLSGGAGDDLFMPSLGADVIDGGAGDDEIHALPGDTVTGGDGTDAITWSIYDWFEGPSDDTGPTIVTDFTIGEDVLTIERTVSSSSVTVLDWADGAGADVFLDGELIVSVTGGAGMSGAGGDLRVI